MDSVVSIATTYKLRTTTTGKITRHVDREGERVVDDVSIRKSAGLLPRLACLHVLRSGQS